MAMIPVKSTILGANLFRTAWAGTVVINAIGITRVNMILKGQGYAEIGYLPAIKIDLRTSVAFQTLTNQILVVARINHKEYKITRLNENNSTNIISEDIWNLTKDSLHP